MKRESNHEGAGQPRDTKSAKEEEAKKSRKRRREERIDIPEGIHKNQEKNKGGRRWRIEEKAIRYEVGYG
jgi:hypothetical protein